MTASAPSTSTEVPARGPSSYRFAISPKWIISHVLVIALIVAMSAAFLWQLSRRTEVAERNDRIRSRTAEEVVPIERLVPPTATLADGAELEYRPVTARGTFDRSGEVLVRNRSYNGAPGSWALTPLVLDDDRVLFVNRGWIPYEYEPDGDRSVVDPPPGEVTVTGWIRPTEVRRGLNAADAADGVLTSVARPDLVRLQQQTDAPVVPVFVQASDIDPAVGELPAPVPLPELSGGPHLSYAMQWATFTVIAIVGYPLILRRVATGKAASARDPMDR